MKKQYLMLLAVLAVLLSSCESPLDKIKSLLGMEEKSNTQIQYLAFQSEEDGGWGLVSLDGQVLFEDKFEHQPTSAINGRFMVKNDDGNYEIYTATATPQRVGTKEYVSISDFGHGVALAAEPGKFITIIDMDANVVATLDEIDGQPVDDARYFCEGISVVSSEGCYGAINTKGEVVIPMEYCSMMDCKEGYIIAVENKYKKAYQSGETRDMKWSVLDKEGNLVMTISGAKYDAVGWQGFQSGLLGVSVKTSDDEYKWGLINTKGEVVVKPNKKYHSIGEIFGNYFSYYTGEKWAVATLDGTTVLRPKYICVTLHDEKRMICSYQSDDEESWLNKITDIEGNTLGDEDYMSITGYHDLDGKHCVVGVDYNDWSIVDYDGKVVPGVPAIFSYNLMGGDYLVQSDYLEIPAFVDELKITDNGLDGVPFGIKPVPALEHKQECDGYYSSMDPSNFYYTTTIYYGRSISNAYISISLDYDSKISYATNSSSSGYAFSNSPMKRINVTMNHYSKLRGKLRPLYTEVTKRFRNLGTVVKESRGAILVRIGENYAYVCLESDNVSIQYGALNPSEYDVNSYDEAEENLTFEEYDGYGC